MSRSVAALFSRARPRLRSAPALGAPRGLGRGRCRDHRRGRGRHRGGAKGRGRGPALRADRGERSCRRPLRHRYAHLRRAVRSRRALAAHARHQSGGEARGARRARRLSGAAGAEAAHRPRATRAKARWRTISRRWCARTAPSGCGARQGRHRRARRRCRRIWATGGRRSNSCSGRSAAARISTKSRRWISRARSSATSTRSAARG